MSLLEIAAAVSAFAAVVGVIITVLFSATKIGRMSGMMEQSIVTQNATLAELKKEVSKVGEVVTTLAVQSNRMDTLTQDMTLLRKKVDEMAHGEGFVFPLAHIPQRHST